MQTTTNKHNWNDSILIDLLGGTNEVAKLCNVAPPAVAQWRHRGLPHGQLVFLAAKLEKDSHGLVTRKDLFPNTWWMIWPELAKNRK
jgi:DNA-binding transcriptional regulator YdaS (Cro superfamily)